MATVVVGFILAGLVAVTAAEVFPRERGVIMTAFQYNNKAAFKLLHLPMYPGYENFSGNIPGVGFHNPDIRFLSVDVDYANKYIYMYDYHMRGIAMGTGYNRDLNISGMEFHYIHLGVSSGTVQVAVDWLSHTIYWTDAVFRWIIAAPGQVDKIERDYYKIIADDHLDYPDGVTLDPFDGYLFWTDNGIHPKIERSNLMGDNRETIVSSKGGVLFSPLSIETDIFEKRIYWLDSMAESVMTATYHGKDIQMIQRLPNSRLLDLAIFRDCVFLTDTLNKNMYTLNKTLGPDKGKSESNTISFKPDSIYGIAVYSQETQPLKDSDICAEKNCEQMCISTKWDATCVCAHGYAMNRDGLCLEIGIYHRAIVYANATHICKVDIRTLAHFGYDPVCIFTIMQQPLHTSMMTSTSTTTDTSSDSAASDEVITMFDMNMENTILYFVSSENTIYERETDLHITDDLKIELVRANGTISGIAYDAGDSNSLYWCESDTGVVKMINLVRRSPISVSTRDMSIKNPRNIIVLIKKRKLAWIAGIAGNMSIQKMNMDGNNIATVIDKVTDIVSLVVDEDAQLFYFLSDGKVYSIMLDGSNKKTVISDVEKSAFKFLFYKSYVAWVYNLEGYAHLMKTEDIKTQRVIGHGYFDNVSKIVDIKVLDAKLQSSEVHNPCAYQNGGCSHICVTKYTNDVMTMVCECKMGFTLDEDLKSCNTATVNDNFIIVADRTNKELQQINLANNEIHAIDNTDSGSYAGIYFDAESKKIIWSEFLYGGIFSAYLNGSDHQTVAELGNAYAYRFDKDLTTGNLYYTANRFAQIGMITPSGNNVRLHIDFSTEYLGDIVVHPGKEWLFFTAYASPSYIARADMYGKNIVRLIQGSHVLYPIGLAIDFNSDKLYWSDSSLDTIQRCDLEAVNCKTIVNMTGTNRREQIRDLVIDGAFLYYSAYRNEYIVRMDLQEPYERTRIGQNTGLGKLDTMVLYKSTNKNIQPVAPVDVVKKQSGSWILVGAVITTFVLLLVVIIALVGALVFFIRRSTTKSSSTNTGSASYCTTDNNVAIGSPPHLQNASSMNNTNDKSPTYLNKLPPMCSDSGSDDDIVDCTSNNESLPEEQESQQGTHDKAILTSDSWLKEQVKAGLKK